MASYRERFRDWVNMRGAVLASVMIRDLSNALDDLDWLDKDNDELRRENERMLKALVRTAAPPPPVGDECPCGRPRAGCEYHG